MDKNQIRFRASGSVSMLMASQEVRKRSFLSFPRRRESSLSIAFWTPASAGVTTWGAFYESIKIETLKTKENLLNR
jgi:hypothetical protein